MEHTGSSRMSKLDTTLSYPTLVAVTLFSKGVFGRVWQKEIYCLECEELALCYSDSQHGTWPTVSWRLTIRLE